MTLFEKELKNMFNSSDLIKEKAYSGKSIIGKLDEDLRVKMSFVTTGVADVYSALRVKIINRTEGEVDSELFKFVDIIGTQRTAYNNKVDPHIWHVDGKDEWYLPISQNERDLIADTVLDYVEISRRRRRTNYPIGKELDGIDYVYTKADCDCKLCLYYKEGNCIAEHCCCLEDKIRTRSPPKKQK